jgi:hypothetical protein
MSCYTDSTLLQIHCLQKKITIGLGQVCIVKEFLQELREDVGFKGGYLYANGVLLQDDEEIIITENFFYEVRYGVLEGKILISIFFILLYTSRVLFLLPNLVIIYYYFSLFNVYYYC